MQKYQIVAIGDSVSQCEDNYLNLLLSNGVKEEAKDDREIETITGENYKDCTGGHLMELLIIYLMIDWFRG